MRVLLAGGTGTIGLPLVRQLRGVGHEVAVLHRSPRGVSAVRAAGATTVRADVLDRQVLSSTLDGHRYDAVISQLTALRKTPTRHRDMAATNRLRIEGTANLLDVARRVGARRFVTQSMALGYGYGDFGDRVLTEADPFAPPGDGGFEQHLAAMRAGERQMFEAPHVEGIALRYGFFYGPGPAGDTLVDGLRRRRLPVVNGSGVLPWLYIDDAASATVAALERGVAGSAYNIADDQPVSMSDLFRAMAGAIGAPEPWTIPAWLLSPMPYARAVMKGGLRVSTDKASRELGWTPRVPTYHDGVAELARHYVEMAR